MSAAGDGPSIFVSGGNWGNENWSANYAPLQVAFENLISGATDIAGSGTKTLILDSNEIAAAWSYMGTVYETPAQVAANYDALVKIANYCRQNGITVEVDAVLTNSSTYSDGSNALVQQWAPIAAAVGLPISRVQDVNEMATLNMAATSASVFANVATVEANAVRTLLQAYQSSSYKLTANNLQVGDMEGGTPQSSSLWWNAYNQAAQALGVPKFSYFTTDLNQYAPWIDTCSQASWHSTLQNMSAAAAAAGMSTNVLVAGAIVDLTPSQYTAQAEQNAMDVALLVAAGSVTIGSLELQSWASQPVGVGLVTSPTSSANEAVEIAATFSLAASGLITARGTASVEAPAQLVLATGTAQPVSGLAVGLSLADTFAGNRVAVVLVAQTGALSATQSGTGTIRNNGTNILVLSGTAADIAAELASVTLNETYAGPDTLDIEVFGTQGRLADTQVNIWAAASGSSVGTVTASSGQQGWLSASTILNTGTVIAPGSFMTSETLYWNTAGFIGGTIGGQSAGGGTQFLNVIAIHEPLAEYGIKSVSSITLGTTADVVVDIYDSAVDWQPFTVNGYANNAGANNMVSPQTTGWNSGAFNAAAALTPMVVASTVNTFDPGNGKLLSVVNRLAPDPITVVDLTGSHSDAFATAFVNGGTQVIEYNRANNPGWNPAWGGQFDSVTLTYDGLGRLAEAVFQGGASNPWFVIDNVFDPITGQLWEQFQTAAPPSADGAVYKGTADSYEAGFVSGPLFITQFNTGNNPNWNYLDWGSKSLADTEVWTDYFVMANYKGFALSYSGLTAGDISNYPYQFVSGLTLNLLYLPGTNIVDLNHLGMVTIDSQVLASGLNGLTSIDAAGASGVVNITGLQWGGSVLIGGDGTTTIQGYGGDTIVAGAGMTSITTGNGGSNIQLASSSGTVSVTGNNNTIAARFGGTLTLSGTGNTIRGSSVTATVASAGAVVTQAGMNNVLRFTNGGTLFQTGTSSSGNAYGDGLTVEMDINGGTIGVAGNNNAVYGGYQSIINVVGNADTVSAWAGSTICVSGTSDIVSGSSLVVGVTAGTVGLLVDGSADTVSAVSGTSLRFAGMAHSLIASGATVGVLAGTGLTLRGSNNVIQGSAGASITIASGTGNVVIGSGSTITANGACTGDIFTLSGQDTLVLAQPAAFDGMIDAKPGDKIVLQGAMPTDAVCSDGRLLVKSGSSTILSAAVSGSMTSDAYTVSGSIITIGSPAASSSPAGRFSVSSATSGSNLIVSGTAYSGPVAGLTSQFMIPTTEQIMVTALSPNVFIVVGAQGQNNPLIAGIDVSSVSGNNILDSYANSSFLINGSGIDQDYIDARAATQNSWSTIVNFHSGSNVTIWGVTPQDFVLQWIGDTYGAPGSTGLTAVYTSNGKPKIGVTLAGYRNADLVNGRLTVIYNSIDGNYYASIHGN